MNKKTVLTLIASVMFICSIIFVLGIVSTLQRNIQNFETWREKPLSYTTDFDIDDFPYHYRKETTWNEASSSSVRVPDWNQWMIIWLARSENLDGYLFNNTIFAKKSKLVMSTIKQPHPIWMAPNLSKAQLERIPKIVDYDSYLEFYTVTSDIQYYETNMWQDQDWMAQVSQWEIEQTQARILYMYLIFLDNQSQLPSNIYQDLDILINNIGQESLWYESFNDHLDDHW